MIDESMKLNATQTDLLVDVLDSAMGEAYDLEDASYIGEMLDKVNEKQELTPHEASELLDVLSNVPDGYASILDQRKTIDILSDIKNGKETDIQPSLQQDVQCLPGYEYVNGYYKSDGTYVKGHCRKKVK